MKKYLVICLAALCIFSAKITFVAAQDEAPEKKELTPLDKEEREYFKYLLKDLHGSKYRDRKAAKLEIVKLGKDGKDIGEEIIKLLSSPNFTIRREALEILGEIRDPKALKNVEQIFLNKKEDPTVHDEALTTLVKYENINFFISLMGSEDDKIREAALMALHKMWRLALPKLTEALKSPNERVRYEAQRAFKTRLYSFLALIIYDEELQEKYIVSKGSSQAARDALKYKEVEERWIWYRKQVKKLGDKGIEMIIETANNKQVDVKFRFAALTVLGVLNYPETVKEVVAALKDDNPNIRYGALTALSHRGVIDDETYKHMESGIIDDNPSVVIYAIQLCAKVDTARTGVKGLASLKILEAKTKAKAEWAANVANDPKTPPEKRFAISIIVATLLQKYDFLLEKLNDPDLGVRLKLLRALTRATVDEKLSAGIIKFLKDAERTPAEIQSAFKLLSMGKDKNAIPFAEKYMFDQDAETAISALDVLGEAGAAKLLTAEFDKLLAHNARGYRVAALKACGTAGTRNDAGLVKKVLEVIRKHPDPATRRAAFLALEGIFRAPHESRMIYLPKTETDNVDVYLKMLKWTKNPPPEGDYSPYKEKLVEDAQTE